MCGAYRAVDNESQVLLGVNCRLLWLEPSRFGSNVGKVNVLARLIAAIAQQNNLVGRQARDARSLKRNGQERLLSGQEPGARILDLVGELVYGVGRVGGACDTSGPESAKVDDGCVDVVGGVEGEDVAFFPVVHVLETLAEVNGGLLDLGVRV